MQDFEPHTEAEHAPMPLLAHLGELRRRLLYCVGVVILAFPVYVLLANDIYRFLTRPLVRAIPPGEHQRLIYTALPEAFATWFKLGVYSSLILSFPFVAYQVWRFVAPGLYRRERGLVWPFLVATPVLFGAGALLAYEVVMPVAYQFFMGFQDVLSSPDVPVQLEARVSQYATLSLQIMFAFGLCFQLPVVIVLLGLAGIVDAAKLARWRKYMVVVILCVAALLTPPDVLSQLGLAVPMVALYEVSILVVRHLGRTRRQ